MIHRIQNGKNNNKENFCEETHLLSILDTGNSSRIENKKNYTQIRITKISNIFRIN